MTTSAVRESTRWAWTANRWIGGLFAVGAVCFLYGGLALVLPGIGLVRRNDRS